MCGGSYEVGNYASGSGGALAEYINTYNLTTQSDMTIFYYAGSGNSVKLSITAIAVWFQLTLYVTNHIRLGCAVLKMYPATAVSFVIK